MKNFFPLEITLCRWSYVPFFSRCTCDVGSHNSFRKNDFPLIKNAGRKMSSAYFSKACPIPERSSNTLVRLRKCQRCLNCFFWSITITIALLHKSISNSITIISSCCCLVYNYFVLLSSQLRLQLRCFPTIKKKVVNTILFSR